MNEAVGWYCISPQGVFKNGSRRRKEADFGAKNTSASLPRRLRLLRRFARCLRAGRQSCQKASLPLTFHLRTVCGTPQTCRVWFQSMHCRWNVKRNWTRQCVLLIDEFGAGKCDGGRTRIHPGACRGLQKWVFEARAPVHGDFAFPVAGCAGGGFLNVRSAHNARMCPRTIPKGLRPQPKVGVQRLPWVRVRKWKQRQRRCGRGHARGQERIGHNRVAVGEV